MKTSKRASSIFEISGIGQAPSKDFFSLTVVNNSIIWRTWRISLRNEKTSPSETVQSWQEFTDTSNGVRLQGEIRRVFGNDILSRVNSLVSQCWLTYMKSDILVEIFVWLDVLDVVRLAQVCRAIHKVCSSEALWRRLFLKNFSVIPTNIPSLAQDVGWKEAFRLNRQKVYTVKNLKKVKIQDIGEQLDETYDRSKKMELVTA
ncbi:unnamed protein product [Porites lobata]|uniref:F-box domain-containing protein n=1 Tax=Porites lobata TaxID=104759 RepID=A0ABN8PK18_9CNID|nr:unnamed protein product [Porites lobata]